MNGLHPGLKLMATALVLVGFALLASIGESNTESDAAKSFRAIVFLMGAVGAAWWIWS